MGQQYLLFFLIQFCYFGDFMCFIKRETCNLFLKFREIIQWRETVLRVHGMKSDEKLFFCQVNVIF